MVIHRDIREDSLDSQLLRDLQELAGEMKEVKSLLLKHLEDPSKLSDIRAARERVVALLGRTILKNKNHGKESPSNLELIHEEKCFKVYNDGLGTKRVGLGEVVCFPAKRSRLLAEYVIVEVDERVLDGVMIQKNTGSAPRFLPQALAFKPILRTEASPILYNLGDKRISEVRTLTYLTSFNAYNEEIVFDNKTRQDIVSLIKNKKVSHSEGWTFPEGHEIPMTMIAFQIAWEIVYNFLKIDSFC